MLQNRSIVVNQMRIRREWRTPALVAHRTISQIAALGNGYGNFWLDPRIFSRVREHHSAEAFWILAQLLHLSTAAARNWSICILCCFCTRNQLHSFHVWRRSSTFSSSICSIQAGNPQNHKESQSKNVLHCSLHLSSSVMCKLPQQFFSLYTDGSSCLSADT